jgi:hypothetical protein
MSWTLRSLVAERRDRGPVDQVDVPGCWVCAGHPTGGGMCVEHLDRVARAAWAQSRPTMAGPGYDPAPDWYGPASEARS